VTEFGQPGTGPTPQRGVKVVLMEHFVRMWLPPRQVFDYLVLDFFRIGMLNRAGGTVFFGNLNGRLNCFGFKAHESISFFFFPKAVAPKLSDKTRRFSFSQY